MEEQAPTLTKQNRLTVHYLDNKGKRLNEDLSVFGAVGSGYSINAPEFHGYLLTDISEPLVGKMPAEEKAAITLTYASLGSVILRGIDNGPQLISLKAKKDKPTEIEALSLPEPPAGKAFYEEGKGYTLIADPSHFIPADPTGPTIVQAMTAEEAEKDELLRRADDIADKAQAPIANPGIGSRTAAKREAAAEEAAPAATPTAAPNLQSVQLLLAKALRRQAELLDLHMRQDVLTDDQLKKLIHNMHDFLRAITLLNGKKD